MPTKKEKRISNIIFALLLLFVILYIKIDVERTMNLKDGGLVKLSAYNHYTSHSYHKGHSSGTNYLQFRFRIDEETYTVNIETSSLGKGENYIYDLDGVNTIERYVLYSKDFSVANKEYVSLNQYWISQILIYVILFGSIILFIFPPRFLYPYFLQHAKPNYKKEDDFLAAWPYIHYSGIASLWAITWFLIEMSCIFLFVVEDELGLRIALSGMFLSLVLLIYLLFRHQKKEFIAIYPDEVVFKLRDYNATIKKSEITAYTVEKKNDGSFQQFKFLLNEKSFYLGTNYFEEKALKDYLIKYGYILEKDQSV